MGSLVLWRRALGREPEAGLNPAYLGLGESLVNCLFLSLVAALSPLSEGSY